MHSLVWDPLVSRSIIEAASGHAYLMEEQNLPSCSIYRVQTGASCRVQMSAAAPSGTLTGDFFLSFTHAYAECRAIFLTTSTMCFFRKVLFSWPFFTKHTAYIVKDFCKEISNHKTLIIYFQSQTTANGCETKKGNNTCSFCQCIILIVLHYAKTNIPLFTKHITLFLTYDNDRPEKAKKILEFTGSNLLICFNNVPRTFLVVQWLRIHLLMKVQSLVQNDSLCHRAAKPVFHNSWAHVL